MWINMNEFLVLIGIIIIGIAIAFAFGYLVLRVTPYYKLRFSMSMVYIETLKITKRFP